MTPEIALNVPAHRARSLLEQRIEISHFAEFPRVHTLKRNGPR
jgi:hypothetical protein